MNDTEKLHLLVPMMHASAHALDLNLPQESHDAILRDMAAILNEARVCEESLAEDSDLVEIAPVFRP